MPRHGDKAVNKRLADAPASSKLRIAPGGLTPEGCKSGNITLQEMWHLMCKWKQGDTFVKKCIHDS